MSALLSGRSLIWSCYDPSQVVAVALQSMLRDLLDEKQCRAQLMLARGAAAVVPESPDLVLGLAVWRFCRLDELAAIGQAIHLCRQRSSEPICVVYCQASLRQHAPILCEAGAQLVVSSVPSLQRVIRRVLPRIPLSEQGYHPLTSGLVEYLPWPELD